jgi:hypothetical protein
MSEITELINKIKLMPEGFDKDLEVFYLKMKLSLLLQTDLITKEDRKEYLNLINNLFPESIKHIEEADDFYKNYLLEQLERLNTLYKDVLLEAKKYRIVSDDVPDFNPYEYMYLVEDFFEWYNPNMLKLYKELDSKGLIYECALNSRYAGKTLPINKDESAILISTKYDGLQYLTTLTHEIAHAYEFSLQKNKPKLAINFLSSECISKITDKLFITYLKENEFIDKEALDIFEYNSFVNDLLFMDCSYVVNNDTINSETPNWGPTDLGFFDYLEKSVLKHKYFIYYKKYSYLLHNKYSYAALFSQIVHDKLLKDENWGKKFVDEFPTLSRELSSDELLNLFSDDEYKNASIDKVKKLLKRQFI